MVMRLGTVALTSFRLKDMASGLSSTFLRVCRWGLRPAPKLRMQMMPLKMVRRMSRMVMTAKAVKDFRTAM